MNKVELMTAILLISPLLSSLIALLVPFSKALIRTSVIIFSTLSLGLMAFITIQPVLQTVRWTWITMGTNSIDLIFEFNNLTIPLALAVLLISFLVNIYSIGFFKWDHKQPRYFATLSLFTFSMLGLTLSGNLLQTFVFWELVGATSYLLIGFYRERSEAGVASTKALIMNKIGDAGFIVALMAIYVQSNSFEISGLETMQVPTNYSLIIAIGLTLAAFSKSGQFPFHTWLPDAMEGPTPISALIHSATMVAAGVFLIIRVHFLFTIELLQTISLVGALTSIVGGVQALREEDLKKILAWSTISQLGLMIMIAGFSDYKASFVHLLSHAVFKAGLFLVAGIIISSAANSISELKTVKKSLLLIVSATILVVALMGLPFTIGFLSKEYLISSISSTLYTATYFLINVISILYSGRILSFLYPIKKLQMHSEKESFLLMVPVILLSIGSLWLIFSTNPLSAKWINETWNLNPPSTTITIVSITWSLLWFVIALYLVRKNKIDALVNWVPDIKIETYWHAYLIKPLLFATHVTNQFDNRIIDKGIHGITYANFSIALLVRWFDKNLIDGTVKLCGWLIKLLGNTLRQFVAGKIQSYIWWTLVALIILFIFSRY